MVWLSDVVSKIDSEASRSATSFVLVWSDDKSQVLSLEVLSFSAHLALMYSL